MEVYGFQQQSFSPIFPISPPHPLPSIPPCLHLPSPRQKHSRQATGQPSGQPVRQGTQAPRHPGTQAPRHPAVQPPSSPAVTSPHYSFHGREHKKRSEELRGLLNRSASLAPFPFHTAQYSLYTNMVPARSPVGGGGSRPWGSGPGSPEHLPLFRPTGAPSARCRRADMSGSQRVPVRTPARCASTLVLHCSDCT